MEQEVGTWDSVLLENISEDSFISNIHQRYKRDCIYVSLIIVEIVLRILIDFYSFSDLYRNIGGGSESLSSSVIELC